MITETSTVPRKQPPRGFVTLATSALRCCGFVDLDLAAKEERHRTPRLRQFWVFLTGDAYFRLAPPLLNRFEKQIFLRKEPLRLALLGLFGCLDSVNCQVTGAC